jgi:hypothetical protein
MLADCAADDIIHIRRITGVDAHYLKPSIIAAGLVRENLPPKNKTQTDFFQHNQLQTQSAAESCFVCINN